MKFKTFSKSAVLLTASLAVLAACGSKNTASSPDYKLEGVTFPLQEKKTLKFPKFQVEVSHPKEIHLATCSPSIF